MIRLGVGIAIGMAVMWWSQRALIGGNVGVLPVSVAKAETIEDTRGCSREQESADKKLIEAVDPQPDKSFAVMSPDYLQHDPVVRRFAELNHAQGRHVFELQRQAFARLGKTGPHQLPAGDPHYMLIAECDKVVVVRQEWVPDPQNVAKTYEAFSFDVWRIKDGRLDEHWDGARIPNPLPEYLRVPVEALKAQGS